jgi:hypothetical protein
MDQKKSASAMKGSPSMRKNTWWSGKSCLAGSAASAFTRAPAEGSSHAKATAVHDDIIVFEVMTDTLDRPWWEAYRQHLEQSFSQDEIVIRAVAITRL